MTMLWTVLAVIFSLYVLTTTTLLLTAKFKKNKKGNLILDPDSWHFKFCYPILTRQLGSHGIIKDKNELSLPSSICPYTGIVVMIGLTKLAKSDQKEVSLVRAWLSAKKNKVCRKLELASAQENSNKN